MAFYHTCPVCRCNLDPGEKCDCQERKREEDAVSANMIKIEPNGQYRINFDGMERGHHEKVAI